MIASKESQKCPEFVRQIDDFIAMLYSEYRITEVGKPAAPAVPKGTVCGMPCKAMDGGPTGYSFFVDISTVRPLWITSTEQDPQVQAMWSVSGFEKFRNIVHPTFPYEMT